MKTTEFDNVTVVMDWAILEDMLGQNWWNIADYEKIHSIVCKWAIENNAAFYAAEKEYFNIYDAVNKAHEEGKTIVVCENLS